MVVSLNRTVSKVVNGSNGSCTNARRKGGRKDETRGVRSDGVNHDVFSDHVASEDSESLTQGACD